MAYYELRTDTNVGSNNGLLERTVDNISYAMPVFYSGTVYLYAVSLDKEYSAGAKLVYSKARPEAPKDVSLTKNNEGTLITFLDIPTDCIGANVYVNGEKFTALDNVFLFKHAAGYRIRTVEVAYHDQFGEGERCKIDCDVPDITGFYVEKNGANLDFYWKAVATYNVKYVVKVSKTLDWKQGLEIFTTKVNKHRYVYPNDGDFYFMIKAVDEHNNYSANAAWYLLSAAPEINKNIILDFDQEQVGYTGSKLNMYYDVDFSGLKLESNFFNGEYMMSINLPQTYRARNWIELDCQGVTASDLRIIDLDFPVNSDKAKKTLICGVIGDLDGIEVRREIAKYTGEQEDSIFSATLENDLTATGGELLESGKANDFTDCRWHNGCKIEDTVQLAYTLDTVVKDRFSLTFWLKHTDYLGDCIIITLRKTNEAYFLCLGYDKATNEFYLKDNYERRLSLPIVEQNDRDWLMFGMTQTATERSLFVFSYCDDKTYKASGSFEPIGEFDSLYCYPKIII